MGNTFCVSLKCCTYNRQNRGGVRYRAKTPKVSVNDNCPDCGDKLLVMKRHKVASKRMKVG